MRRYIENLEKKEKDLLRRLKEINKKIKTNLGWKSIFKARKIRELKQKKDSLLLEVINIKDKKWDMLSNNHFTTQFKSIGWRIDKLSSVYEDVRLLLLEFVELRGVLEKVRKKAVEQIKPQEMKKFSEIADMFSYASFERRFRKEEDIIEMFKKYVEYFPENSLVLDLGCGRGEFIEILEQNNRFGIGVDIDRGMLKIAKKKGLKVFHEDIFSFLEKKEDKSLDGIFSAQVIEHLDYKSIDKLIQLIRKKLKENGIAIIETINPLSWFAFSQVYLLDPSHKTPVHPENLKFIFERSGFKEIEVIYSSEPDVKLKEVIKDLPNVNFNMDLLNKHIFSYVNYAIKGIV